MVVILLMAGAIPCMQEAATILATPAGNSAVAQQRRELENRLDKAIIRCNEANHVRKIYQQVVEQFQEVCMCWYDCLPA